MQGPAKTVEVMVKTPSEGTTSVADPAEHAAFHAARNARVSLEDEPLPDPDAPNALTSNTLPPVVGGFEFAMAGGSGAGGSIGGLVGQNDGGFAGIARCSSGAGELAGACAGDSATGGIG